LNNIIYSFLVDKENIECPLYTPELAGGGLLRSQGGWTGVKALRRSGDYQKGDERILGDGDFVMSVLSKANESMTRKYDLKAKGYDLKDLLERVAEVSGITSDEIIRTGCS